MNNCRIFRAPTTPANPDYPFCSAACRERDLGNWATGSYRVAAAISSDDELAELSDALSHLDAAEAEDDADEKS